MRKRNAELIIWILLVYEKYFKKYKQELVYIKWLFISSWTHSNLD